MEGHALKEEITTLQFMIAYSDVHSKQQYLVQLKALLGEQRRLRESVASLSTKRPKYEKMEGISGTVIDISKGSADGNGSITSVLTTGRQHSTTKSSTGCGDSTPNESRSPDSMM
jgi:hypothetical protein